MPVEPKLIRGKVRTVNAESGAVELNENKNPRDGGGWDNTPAGWATAKRQAGYINSAVMKKSGEESGVAVKPRLPSPPAPPAPRRSASPVKGPSIQSPM